VIIIRPGTLEDHKAILQISKQSKFTKDFSNQVMFSSPAAYEKGWIRVVEEDGRIVGFTCFRVKKRDPEVVLYFVGVDKSQQGNGLGWKLIEDMMAFAPPTHRKLYLNVGKDNEQARSFYEKHGFVVVDEALKGAGLKLRKDFA
jgi:ribosomal protein S18 acetylase RimI-like enzyme